MKIELIRAQKADAKRLAEVYNLSFYSDYLRYGECPGYHKTEEQVLSNMEKSDVYKITADGLIVGAASVKRESDDHCFLGALCVIPDYANRGIGQQAMRLLDKEYPDVKRWALETPADKLENHYFYQKFGFRVTKEYRQGRVLLSYFERRV